MPKPFLLSFYPPILSSSIPLVLVSFCHSFVLLFNPPVFLSFYLLTSFNSILFHFHTFISVSYHPLVLLSFHPFILIFYSSVLLFLFILTFTSFSPLPFFCLSLIFCLLNFLFFYSFIFLFLLLTFQPPLISPIYFSISTFFHPSVFPSSCS